MKIRHLVDDEHATVTVCGEHATTWMYPVARAADPRCFGAGDALCLDCALLVGRPPQATRIALRAGTIVVSIVCSVSQSVLDRHRLLARSGAYGSKVRGLRSWFAVLSSDPKELEKIAGSDEDYLTSPIWADYDDVAFASYLVHAYFDETGYSTPFSHLHDPDFASHIENYVHPSDREPPLPKPVDRATWDACWESWLRHGDQDTAHQDVAWRRAAAAAFALDVRTWRKIVDHLADEWEAGWKQEVQRTKRQKIAAIRRLLAKIDAPLSHEGGNT